MLIWLVMLVLYIPLFISLNVCILQVCTLPCTPSDLLINLDIFLFVSFCVPIFWLVLMFGSWYIYSEVSVEMFIKLLGVFQLIIILFLMFDDIMIMFLGWEGMSLLSFLLISWWGSRWDASSSSVAALFYNRLSDIFFLFCLSIMVNNSFSIWIETSLVYLTCHSLSLSIILSLFLFVSIIGNSSLIVKNYWLPFAIESPTPVSSLLHSSTIVLASVILSIRCSPYLSELGLLFLFVLGFLSILYSSLFGSSWVDLNKIVAFSTSSQLSLLLIFSSLGYYSLLLSYACLHSLLNISAFFLTSPAIHENNGSQDVRDLTPSLSGSCGLYTNILSCNLLLLTGCFFSSVMYINHEFVDGITVLMPSKSCWLLILIVSLITLLYTVVYWDKLLGSMTNNSVIIKSNLVHIDFGGFTVSPSVYLGILVVTGIGLSQYFDIIASPLSCAYSSMLFPWINIVLILFVVIYLLCKWNPANNAVISNLFSVGTVLSNIIYMKSIHALLWGNSSRILSNLYVMEF